MARVIHHPPRHGWTSAGIVLGMVLIVLLWSTGIVLEVWSAETAFQLAEWQNALRHASLVVHGVGAWLVCGVIGRWIAPHVGGMWQRRRLRGRWVGIATALAGAAVALTGLGLLYGPGDWHDATGRVHWWIALLWPAVLAVHARHLRLKP